MSSEELKTLILDFISDLKDNVFVTPDEQGDMMLIEFFFQRLHPDMVMKHIMTNLVPHKKRVTTRDETFFLDNRVIFTGIPEDRIDHYANYVRNRGSISEENRDTIYQYFEEMIRIAEDHRKRK